MKCEKCERMMPDGTPACPRCGEPQWLVQLPFKDRWLERVDLGLSDHSGALIVYIDPKDIEDIHNASVVVATIGVLYVKTYIVNGRRFPGVVAGSLRPGLYTVRSRGIHVRTEEAWVFSNRVAELDMRRAYTRGLLR
jgi:hypothetical protein